MSGENNMTEVDKVNHESTKIPMPTINREIVERG